MPRAHGYKNLISLQQDPRELELNPPKPALWSGEQCQPRGSAARDPDFPCIWGNCSAALSGEGLGERQQDREPGSSTRAAIKAANLFTQPDEHCAAGTLIALRSPGRVVPTRARPPPSPGQPRVLDFFLAEAGTHTREFFLRQQESKSRFIWAPSYVSGSSGASPAPAAPLGAFRGARSPRRAGVTAAGLCNRDSDILWEQASACNYFPTDKRLSGIYCLY